LYSDVAAILAHIWPRGNGRLRAPAAGATCASVSTAAQLLAFYLLMAGAVLVVGAFSAGTRSRDARKARDGGAAG